MQLSARNQFSGHVKEVKLGNIMAEVVVDIGGGHEVVAAITRGSAERLGLAQGSRSDSGHQSDRSADCERLTLLYNIVTFRWTGGGSGWLLFFSYLLYS